MNVYRMSNYNSGKNAAKNISRSYRDINFERLFRRASGGEDFVEISQEAIARLNRESAMNDEKIALMKTVEELFAEHKELMDLKKKPSNFRIYRIEAVKDLIESGSLDFENSDILGETADILLRENL